LTKNFPGGINMKSSFMKKLTALTVAYAIGFAPTLSAYATDYNYSALCGAAATSATNTNTATQMSDQTTSYCAQAGVAKTTVQFQTANAILEMAAGVTLTALAFSELFSAGATNTVVGYSADAASLGLDIAQAAETKSTTNDMLAGISSIGAIAIQAGAKGILLSAAGSIAPAAVKVGVNNTECLVSAGIAFAQGGIAMVEVSSAKSAENTALASVSSVENARGSSGFALGAEVVGGGTITGASGTAVNAGSLTTADLSTNPSAAAITANPALMSAIQSATGQTPNALIAGYSGDGSTGSIAGYVGGAAGLSSTGTAALAKQTTNAAKIAENDGYTPNGYVASKAEAASTTGDLDFNSMMGGLMKKLNPGSGTASAAADPSAIVFRQLDLLPPNKIESNKDISLFARIGYRYHKKASDVDQLNYSSASNQASNQATNQVSPAFITQATTAEVAPATTTTTTLQPARLPAGN
jgi:hypothetical protein